MSEKRSETTGSMSGVGIRFEQRFFDKKKHTSTRKHLMILMGFILVRFSRHVERIEEGSFLIHDDGAFCMYFGVVCQ